MGIPWKWESVTKIGMGMGRNGKMIDGNGWEWECIKLILIISTAHVPEDGIQLYGCTFLYCSLLGVVVPK